MGKRETKQTYKDTQRQSEQTRNDYNQASGVINDRVNEIETGLAPQRDFLTGGYMGMMNNIAQLERPRAINTAELRDTLGAYKGFRDTGGLSNENISRMRGLGGFDEFATTGGYTPESIANIKAQALSPISSYATGTRDELSRRAALQGGYTPGFDAASRQLQRDTARGIADTSLNANVGIQDRINAGRQWGIGGISSSENALADMQTRNRLAALAGEAGIGNSLSGFDAQDIQNLMGVDKFNILNTQGQQAAGLAGLGGLYNSDIGRQQADYDRLMQILNGRTQANLGYLGNQTGLATQPGVGGNILGAIGAGAGLASNFFLPGMGSIAGGGVSGISPGAYADFLNNYTGGR